MAFNNYLEDENDKPYFTTNSLAYYYDKMEGFAKAVEGSAKALNLTKEEIEQRIALRLQEWDGKLEGFDGSVTGLLEEWVNDGTLNHVIDTALINEKILTQQTSYNPVTFGADPTGVSYSDNAMLQLLAVLKDGDTITFKNGTYKFKNSITFKNDLMIDFGMSTFLFDSVDGFMFTGSLKSTKTATVDYSAVTSLAEINLNNTTGMNVGDLVNVLSTDLFNPSRDYYFKGVNALVTRINGNRVTLSVKVPFDMQASKLTVNVFKPITVDLKNIGLIKGTNPIVSNHRFGIEIAYGSKCSLKNITVDNFKTNLNLHRTVSSKLELITTGHAKDFGIDGLPSAQYYDGYGIAIYSCSDIDMNIINANSGQHGITTTGREPNYNLVLTNSTIKAEIWSNGLGHHENIINMVIRNSTVYGFVVFGNTKFVNCDILDSDIGSNAKVGISDTFEFANYIFEDCFIQPSIGSTDVARIKSDTVYKIGSIIFRDCKRPSLVTQITVTGNPKIGEIDLVIFDNCKEMEFVIRDKYNKVVINDSSSTKKDSPGINHLPSNGFHRKINELTLTRFESKNRYTDIMVNLAGKVTLNNTLVGSYTTGAGTGSWGFTNIDKLVFTNVDMSLIERGLTNSTGIKEFYSTDSLIQFTSNSVRTQYLFTPLIVSAKGLTTKLPAGISETFDYVTGLNGVKYKSSINELGQYQLTPTV